LHGAQVAKRGGTPFLVDSPPAPGYNRVAAGDAEESFLTKAKKLLEEKKKLTFFCRHGITHNRETIWQVVKRFDMDAANAQKKLRGFAVSSTEPTQQSLIFGPRSAWKVI